MSKEISKFEVIQASDFQVNIEMCSGNGESEEEADFLFYDQEDELYAEEGKSLFLIN